MANENNSTSSNEQDLLLVVLKHTDGAINMQGIADELGISSNAVAKRVKRHIDKLIPGQEFLVGSTLGSGRSAGTPKGNRKSSVDEPMAPVTPKVPATPRSGSGSKRKVKDIAENIEEAVVEDDGVDNSPSKKGAIDDAKKANGSSANKKAKTTKKASPKTAKSPRTPAKSKTAKATKKSNGEKTDTIVIDDAEDANEDERGDGEANDGSTAENHDEVTSIEDVKHEDKVKPEKKEDTKHTVDTTKVEGDAVVQSTNEAVAADSTAQDNEVKNEGGDNKEVVQSSAV